MNAKLIDGKQLAANLRGEIAAGVAVLKAEKGVTPGLAVILVGDNPASVSYVTAKEKAFVISGIMAAAKVPKLIMAAKRHHKSGP